MLSRRAERALSWAVLVAGLLVGAVAAGDAWLRVGTVWPGAGVMQNLLVAPGGAARGPLRPFDLIVAANGRPVDSTAGLRAEVEGYPPGTTLRYTVVRGGARLDLDVRTHALTVRHFRDFVLEALAPSLMLLGLGVLVIRLKPGSPDSRVFLFFCLLWFAITLLYPDFVSTHRFAWLFFLAWTVSPAVFVHLALTFPERRRVARRHPAAVALPYVLSAVLYAALEFAFVRRSMLVPMIIATYWGAAVVGLVAALARTRLSAPSPLARQRAGVLMAGFAIGFLPPVLGTAAEVLVRVTVPYLEELWRLTLVFPLAVAYAVVRYNLFNLRAVVRAGAIYSAVTGLLVAGYAGALTLLNLSLSAIALEVPPVVPAAIVSLAVVVLVNPVYVRTQALVDRLFFPERYDAQRSIERLADAMTTVLDLERIVTLIAGTLENVFQATGVRLLLAEDGGREYRPPEGGGRRLALAGDTCLVQCLAEHRRPLDRERLRQDPDLAALRDGCLGEMARLGAAVVAPVLFRGAVTALIALGPRRSGAPYTGEDFRLLRLVANQSAVALENARAYSSLQTALRRVEILESVRASLVKFVPRAVQDLIERTPEAPAFDKRAADVSVLFVDIAGYTRISERLDAERLNHLVERYFGAFLDEIWKNGGDVNETAGDGLMVIFQDPDPRQHARAAVATAVAIVERARQINAELGPTAELIALHVGVNSGVAAVGATKIEGTAGGRWTYTASGPVTNVAARLAALGGADAVIIGPETRRRLGDGSAIEDLGEHRLRNVEEPVRVWRVPVPAPSPA